MSKHKEQDAPPTTSQVANTITGFAWDAFGVGHPDVDKLSSFRVMIQSFLDQQLANGRLTPTD